ncbi:MAG TPA: heavy metal-associated domain-containing protein, partial [Bacilli bacterium]|nr:heavy metal-associated domain-containing protein [Bacilli bacterium]
MNKIILKVEGMSCGMCEAHINDVVRKTKGVKKVNADRTK